MLLCLSHFAFLTRDQQENMKLLYLPRARPASVHKPWTKRAQKGFKSQKGISLGLVTDLLRTSFAFQMWLGRRWGALLGRGKGSEG